MTGPMSDPVQHPAAAAEANRFPFIPPKVVLIVALALGLAANFLPGTASEEKDALAAVRASAEVKEHLGEVVDISRSESGETRNRDGEGSGWYRFRIRGSSRSGVVGVEWSRQDSKTPPKTEVRYILDEQGKDLFRR